MDSGYSSSSFARDRYHGYSPTRLDEHVILPNKAIKPHEASKIDVRHLSRGVLLLSLGTSLTIVQGALVDHVAMTVDDINRLIVTLWIDTAGATLKVDLMMALAQHAFEGFDDAEQRVLDVTATYRCP